MRTENNLILLIDDDPTKFISEVKLKLKDEELNYDFLVFDPIISQQKLDIDKNITEISKILNTNEIAFVFIDIALIRKKKRLDLSGIKLAKRLKQKFPSKLIFNITGKTLSEDYEEAISEASIARTDGFIAKPYLESSFDGALLNRILSLSSEAKKVEEFNFQRPSVKDSNIDLLIIAALYENEFENIEDIYDETETDKAFKQDLHLGVMLSDNGKKINLIATHLPNTGMIDASIIASKLIDKYKPKYLLMPGVCAGKKNSELRMGDIIVANKVFLINSGKLTDDGFEPEIHQCKIDESIIYKIRENTTNIVGEIMHENKAKAQEYKKNPLNAHIDPVACSSFVVNKPGYFEEKILKYDRKTIGIEMESYGIARCCELVNNGETKAIIIKSVMDNAESKDDENISYASYTSAQFTKKVIEKLLF